MSDQHPTPQWFTPGGTTTAPRPVEGGHPTAPIPVTASTPPPPPGAFGPGATTGQPGGPAPHSRGRRTAELATVAVLAALLSSGGTIAAAQYWPEDAATTAGTTTAQELGNGSNAAPVVQASADAPDWAATAAAVSPSVVSITVQTGQRGGQGSGVIIDGSGHVLTNNHVVAGAEELTVTLADGRTFQAEVRGTDPSTDLAVITISGSPSGLKAVALGNSDDLAVGDPVMAVGNPLGLAGTVTTGIVSALNRPVTTQAEGGGQGLSDPSQSEPVVTNAIQTSAAINPGNSGGALVDAGGRLIGINSSIATLGASGQSGSIGIGFAIPVNEATSIAEQLIESGTAVHAYLGVTPQDGTASDGSASRAGAEVVSVGENTPASAAGLQEGDVVTAVNGERVESALSLVGHIREKRAGDEVTLTVLRDGNSIEVRATLAAKPTSDG